MSTKPKPVFKVAKFRILKPAGDMTWPELGKILKEVRYRVFRLANLAVSEAYLSFHLFRTGQTENYKTQTIGKLSQRLREMLEEKGHDPEDLKRFAVKGAVVDYIASGLYQSKIKSVTNKSKWSQVIRGQSSLPVFRLNMAIPVRCDKPEQRRLERTENGDVELDLMICRIPYPRVVLQTGSIGDGQRAVLDRLLENTDNSPDGYRQRLFEIKQDIQSGKWHLFVTYDHIPDHPNELDSKIVVGVDLGVSVPLYAAINNGHARLGRRQFQALGHRIKSLQRNVMARRRAIQRSGSVTVSGSTARSGHGRKRKLLPTEILQNRIGKSYTTLNHQLSSSVIKFALDHGAGTIQIEDLTGLKEVLTGTYIGARWRYHQLQKFLEYKSEEAGIILKKINPKYTSRRCSKCGYIHVDFDRAFRDSNRENRKVTRFECPECQYQADPDYNAARNIATIDIGSLIKVQCKKQGLEY